VPAKRGIAPSYEQKSFTRADKGGRLRLVASPDGREGSVTIHTDAALYAGVFGGGQRAELAIARGRHAWVHVARGKARINGHELSAGDAASLSDEAAVRVEGAGATAADETEVLVFDLA
jgi:redox-sensitive bicupin YhaK (pirin superfamily)